MRETELGFVLLLLGKDQEARWEFREVPRVDPRLPRASSGLGIALVRLGKVDEAIDERRRPADHETPRRPDC